MTDDSPRLRRAYARCLRLARDHYENFPVASRLLPAHARPHIAAVYAFARCADDFADEGHRQPSERLALLGAWRDRLHTALTDAELIPADRDASEEAEAEADLFLALGDTIRLHALPVALFEDLLSAFRQDVTIHRYETWSQLMDYCRRSANPVGRIVLRVAGYRDDALDRAADCVSTALQIANFLQDFGRDWQRGRLYVPAEIYQATGARLDDLGCLELTSPWCAALAECTARTRALFAGGRAVCDGVRGRLKLELRLTWLGGMRILDQLVRTGYDPLANRPTLGLVDAAPLLWNALVWNGQSVTAPYSVNDKR